MIVSLSSCFIHSDNLNSWDHYCAASASRPLAWSRSLSFSITTHAFFFLSYLIRPSTCFLFMPSSLTAHAGHCLLMITVVLNCSDELLTRIVCEEWERFLKYWCLWSEDDSTTRSICQAGRTPTIRILWSFSSRSKFSTWHFPCKK